MQALIPPQDNGSLREDTGKSFLAYGQRVSEPRLRPIGPYFALIASLLHLPAGAESAISSSCIFERRTPWSESHPPCGERSVPTGTPERQSENVWSPSVLSFLSGHRWSRSVLCSQTGLQDLGDSSEEKTGKQTFQLWIVRGLCCWSCFFWISWSCSLFLTVKTRQTSLHLTFYNVVCVV